MAEYVVMPKLGFDMREGVLVSWLKQVGDEIQKGDIIAEIESDKATLELESQVAGTLLKLLESEGAVVPIGAHLAIVGAEGEDVSGIDAAAPPSRDADEEAVMEVETAPPAASATPSTEGESALDADFPEGVRASPVARRIAREHGVDLQAVSGSGPNGRIRRADVEEFLDRQEREPTPAAAPQPVTAEIRPEDVVEEASRLRQAIARRMAASKTTVPHFYVTNEIDMAPALALRKQVNALLEEEQKISVNDLIVKAAALALRDFPSINSSFAGDKFIRHQQINVGSAVAVEGGLLTVVQQNTDSSSLTKIADDHKQMIARARSGRIHPGDVQGATFTVSNLGGFDVDHFIAIINPPEAAILAVGTAREVPVVVDGQLQAGIRMKATLSADHRVTDGAEAAQYMQRFKALLEEPMRLLL